MGDGTVARVEPLHGELEMLTIDKAARCIRDRIYYRNDAVPYLLGKALVLGRHYMQRKRTRAQLKGACVVYGCLEAAREAMPGRCYCTAEGGCGATGPCATLTALFGGKRRVEVYAPIVRGVLRATYGTCESARIQWIRARLAELRLVGHADIKCSAHC
jgi:hypothetical protein